MKTDNIVFRKYEKKDRKELENIVRKTWNYDQFCSPKIAQKLAHTYFINCLANQTYTQIACLNNQPIGIIMGKKTKNFRCPLNIKIKQIIANISICLSKESRKVIKIFDNVTQIDNELLKKSKKTYDGEVALFVIDQKQRGKGLGNTLFNSLLHYMNEQEIKDFFLFTDTSCNYKFYEYKGMKKKAEIKQTYNIAGQKADMTFFLYEKNLNNKSK